MNATGGRGGAGHRSAPDAPDAPDAPGTPGAPDASGDFGGIGFGGRALVMTVATLAHPREAFGELLRLVRRLARRALGLLLAPFRLAALLVWSRSAHRRPTFEEHLRGAGEDENPR
ncbi:hypothetical protein [Streptosporangium sp. NPDC023615]|uniref:hypothetical protein n=1 Tax=Streptosporangium sp. NPDC023615 TaxID=3154794 RepID=UPI00344AF65D